MSGSDAVHVGLSSNGVDDSGRVESGYDVDEQTATTGRLVARVDLALAGQEQPVQRLTAVADRGHRNEQHAEQHHLSAFRLVAERPLHLDNVRDAL